MYDLMIDLETMSTDSNAAIIAIGAVYFDRFTGATGAEFYRVIDLQSCVDNDMHVSESTQQWWSNQSEEARAIFNHPNKTTIKQALLEFNYFVNHNTGFEQVQVWGNGASFDCVILGNAFKRFDFVTPWKFWNDRDVRTVVELGQSYFNFYPKRDMPFTGVRHNAVDDAKHQVKYVHAILTRFLQLT